jgi:hypothetical protein
MALGEQCAGASRIAPYSRLEVHVRRVMLVVAGLALVVAACRAEANTIISVEEDRSGTVVFEFGADEEFLSLLESTGADPADVFGSADVEVPGAETIQRTEGEMSYWGVEWEFDDVDEISQTLEGAGDTTGADFSDLSFEMDDDGAVLDAVIATPTEAISGFPLEPEVPLGDVADIFAVNFVIGMPGTVVEHNADEVLADGSLLWEIPITGGTIEMSARSEFGGSSLWWLWIVLGAVLVIGLAALVGAVIASRRQSRRAVEEASTQAAATTEAEDDGATTETVSDDDEPDDDQPE